VRLPPLARICPTLVMRERIESHQATTFWQPQGVQMEIAA
jgi:hypothetical protein